jgi:hypothetical protein
MLCEIYMAACAFFSNAENRGEHCWHYFDRHLLRNIDRVDTTMDSIREQMDLTNEISDAISNPVGMGHDIDEVRASELGIGTERLTTPLERLQDELKNELEELEQAELNERLVGADHVPVHTPALAGPSRVNGEAHRAQAVDDDDAELRALQAELAMWNVSIIFVPVFILDCKHSIVTG